MEDAIRRRRFATLLVDRNPSSCVEAPFWCMVARPGGRPGTPAPGWGLEVVVAGGGVCCGVLQL